jgi:outer membrane protein
MLCILLALAPAEVPADDLLSVYQLALQADPSYQAAIEAHRAAIEVLPQRRAVLLPNLGIAGDASRDRFDPRGGGDTSYATNQTYSVLLRQTLYNREQFTRLGQADSQVARADANLLAARQELIVRVATRYFLVLGAQDNLDFTSADKEAISRTLEQAQQRFEVGLASITDTLEARARYDLAVSDEINAEKLLSDAREALRELTGELPGKPEILQEEIPLKTPAPADQEEWVGSALQQNPLVLAASAAAESAKQEIQVQNSGHFPTFDMTADYSYRDNRFGGFQDLQRNDSAIGVELSLPLYQGGLVSSQTRESRYLYEQSRDELEQQQRTTKRQVRNNYQGILTGISRVEALQQAVASNEKAVEAAQAGFDVGTRTIVDVLDAQRELLRARRDYARSRYDYLLDTLRLKQATGIVDETDLAQINELLVGNEK